MFVDCLQFFSFYSTDKCPCTGILLFLDFSTSCLSYELEEEESERIQDNESGIRYT